MIRGHFIPPRYGTAILWLASLPVLYFISRHNYNLFHSLVDGTSIIIAASVFVIVWNVRRIIDNEYFLYVGISFLFFALLDFMHVLGNKNMGVFPEYGNLGPALYIASRYVLSISLLIAPLFIKRRLNSALMFLMYSLVTSFILLSIFYWRIFPVCIVEGVGLTPFKVISDYVICLIFLGAIGLLLIRRRSFDPNLLRIMVFSIILFIATGVAFTLYADPFGIMNAVGHFLQIASFYLVYLAIIETSLTKPQDVLYRKLKQSEEKLADNVKRLDDANVELKQEITERKRTEEALRQSREWLRVTLRSIGDAVITTDTAGRITFLNPVAATLTGWALEEAQGRPIQNVLRTVDEVTRLPGEDVVNRVLTEGCVINMANHTALVRRDGLEIPIEDSAAPIMDSDLNLLGVVIVFHDVTEKRRAEEALHQSAEKFRIVADFAYDWEYWQSPDNRFLYVSPSCERITGYSREEFFKDPGFYPRIIHPEDRERVLEHLRDDQFHQEPCELEFRIVGRDGQVRWIAHACQSVLDENGGVLGRRASNRDITERKQMDERLRESEERYRTLFGTMTEGFALHEIVTDPQGRPCDYRFLDVNPAFERLTGLKREDLVGRTVLEVLPGTESHWLENYGRVVLTGEPLHVENYSAALDRWYEVFAYRSAPGRFAVVFSDVTERKQIEKALRESESKYRKLFENMTEEVHFWRLVRGEGGEIQTWRLVDANPPTLKSWRRSSLAEIKGKTTDEIFGPGAKDHYMPVVQKIMTEGVPYSFEDYFDHLDKYFRFTSVPLGDHFMTTGSDITTIKKAEKALRQSRDELELRVQERTAELERRNRELQEFAFVASHDLSEPLRKIQTFGSLLEAKSAHRLDEKSRDYVSRMAGAANRMQELLYALLSYSRLDTNAQKFRPLKLDQIVKDAAADLEVPIRKIEARVEVGELPTAYGDPHQLRQLFQNLIANAVKYHRPEAKPVVRIHGEVIDGACHIFLEDNGIGFDEKYLDKIFQPFQRLHEKSEYPGTGIGLAICRKIVDRHRGTITAKSTLGKGSTFFVTLPSGCK